MENRPYATRLKPAMYSVDVSAAYCQTLQGCYYKGSMTLAAGNKGDTADFLLVNPKQSRLNLYVNQVLYANLSSANLKVICSIGQTPDAVLKSDGTAIPSANVVGTNTVKINHQPGGVIYSGMNFMIKGQMKADTVFTVPSYQTIESMLAGSRILAPGMCFIAQINAIVEENIFESSVSFGWWEELAEKE
mgnify:CR=1 FL=1